MTPLLSPGMVPHTCRLSDCPCKHLQIWGCALQMMAPEARPEASPASKQCRCQVTYPVKAAGVTPVGVTP